jgi:phage tail-like protein
MADDNYDGQRITAATFLVEVDGVEIGRFMEISGLEVTVETDTIAEGGQNSYAHKVPKGMTWPNITLKRGVTQGNGLFDWLNKASGEQFAANGNKLTRNTAAITLIGPGGDRLRAWEFDGAFPVKWSGPNFSVSAAEAAVESLEITHHGFRSRDLS